MVVLFRPIDRQSTRKQLILSPERLKLSQSLIEQGSSTAPTTAIGGIARALTGVLGGFVQKQEAEKKAEGERRLSEILLRASGGAGTPRPGGSSGPGGPGAIVEGDTSRPFTRSELNNALAGIPGFEQLRLSSALTGIESREKTAAAIATERRQETATIAAEERQDERGLSAEERADKRAIAASKREFNNKLRLQLAKPIGTTGAAKNAVSIGLTPGTPEYRAYIKEVTTKKPFESEESKQLVKRGVKNLETTNEASDAAKSNLTQIQSIRQLGQVPTGTVQEMLLPVNQFLASFNLEPFQDKDVTSRQELLKAASNRLALELRNPKSGAGLPGSASDRDVKFLVASVVGIGKTPAANAFLLNNMEKVANYKIALDEASQDYVDTNGLSGLRTFQTQFGKNNPIFNDQDQAQLEGLQELSSGLNPEGISPTPAAIEFLLANPNNADQFDATFGALGFSAADILQQNAPVPTTQETLASENIQAPFKTVTDRAGIRQIPNPNFVPTPRLPRQRGRGVR